VTTFQRPQVCDTALEDLEAI